MIDCLFISLQETVKGGYSFQEAPNLSSCPDERKEGHRTTDRGHINFTQKNFNNAVAENKEPDH